VRHFSIRGAAAMLLLCGAAAGLTAQKPTTLFVVVTNLSGVRIAGVELTVANSTLHAVTNDSGEFMFGAPPTGRVRLTAHRLGFKPLEKGFKIDPGESRRVDFELEGIPDLLDTVTVVGRGGNGRMAEFWNRRIVGNGAVITRDEIERRKPYRPSDLLRTVAGVRVNTGDMTDHPVIQMGRSVVGPVTRRSTQMSASECRVNYYLDGSWVASGTFHIDDLSPTSIEAIEVYRGPAEVPAKFRQRETACGLIVIWTREPPPREKPGA
jgi:hypothetical protein